MQKSAPREKNKSRDELAKIAGVSHDTIENYIIHKNE
ncbi:DNA-binding XRE family transcriptional regulator [Clostridium beijerinckii]|nr:DNA-binding XRE family transcriptional regulator [Clostridium beijerinckii]